jgi:general secretion pathway protein N
MQARRCVILTFAFGIAIAGTGKWIAHAAVEFPRDLLASDPKPPLHQTGNPLWSVPIANLNATRDRPIFSASRRPARPPAVFVAAVPPPPSPAAVPLPDRPPLVLLGTIIGGSLHIGIFHEESTTKTVRLSVGESREGWILRSVTANDANFEATDRVATLVLRPPFQSAMRADGTSELTEPLPPVRRRKR